MATALLVGLFAWINHVAKFKAQVNDVHQVITWESHWKLPSGNLTVFIREITMFNRYIIYKVKRFIFQARCNYWKAHVFQQTQSSSFDLKVTGSVYVMGEPLLESHLYLSI
jgi:hypothetical protein